MKKIISTLLAMTLAAGCLTGCVNNKNAAADSSKIFIGSTAPLTGSNATYGISERKGALLAMEEINADGGVNGLQFEVRYEDNEGDPIKAVSSHAILMDAGMHISLGGTISSCTLAVAEEAKKDGILMLAPSGTQKDCTKHDNAFRICFMDPDQGKHSAEFLKEAGIAQNIAILYEKSNDYSVGIAEAFLAKAEEIGLNIVTEQAFTNQSNTDFSVQLQAIKSSGADLIFLPIYAQEAAYVLTQAGKMGLDIAVMGTDGMDGVIEKIGEENMKYTEGVILLTPFSSDSDAEPTASFVTHFKETYDGEIPDQFAANAYDAVYTIAECLKKTGAKPSDADFNEKMIAAMTEIEVKGVTGTMTWTKEGEPNKPAKVMVIENGAYKEFTK